MTTPESCPEPPWSALRKNIEIIARLEEDFRRRRSFSDRVADLIGGFTGSLAFVLVHILVYGGWILVNVIHIPGIRPFDPFPFLLLSMIVSVEAIFLSTFVLMKQNRMSRREDQRAELDLQINLLAEQELTVMLNLLNRIAIRLGEPPQDPEIHELTKETPVEQLARELERCLPKE